MMRHTFNISIAALAVAAMSLLATGCQKQNVQGDGTAYPLSFEISVGSPEIGVLAGDGTKADNRKTGTSTIENFTVAGYTDSAEWFPQTTVNTSSMTFSDKLWLPGEEHTFYAYANMPASSVATATIASTGVTLNYTAVPTSQASQQDILLGSYKGKGTNGKASIQFYHPLAAVAFKVGTIRGVTKINSITLDGVYKSGSVKLSETSGTPAFAWTASETQNGVYQTSLNVTTFTTNTAIGDPFILIPQTFSSKPLTVKIALTTDEGDKTVTATLSTGSIAAGKNTTYAINYSTAKGLNFSTPVVTAWGAGDNLTAELEEPEPYVEIPAKYDGTTVTTLKWYRQNLAISASGKKSWKGYNTGDNPAVKVPGANDAVIVGDYFQWAAYAGYCGDSTDADKGLLIYNSFTNTKCVGDSGSDDSFTLKSEKLFDITNAPYGGSSYSKYNLYNPDPVNLDSTDDVAHIILGEDWRMPTSAEFQALYNATYWAWDATDNGYYVFLPDQGTSGSAGTIGTIADTDKKEDALLFFPAAGVGYGTDLRNAENVGRYWSSSLFTDVTDYAYDLIFSWLEVLPQYNGYRYYGFSVRPVSDK